MMRAVRCILALVAIREGAASRCPILAAWEAFTLAVVLATWAAMALAAGMHAGAILAGLGGLLGGAWALPALAGLGLALGALDALLGPARISHPSSLGIPATGLPE